jgi:hydroxypyruvate isomerase
MNMIEIDVCMETVFTDVPFLERLPRIAGAGFRAVEAWFPEMHVGDDGFGGMRRACDAAGLRINNIVVNAPDGSIGGSLVDPAERPKYLDRVRLTLDRCRELGCSLAITCTGNAKPGLPGEVQRRSVVDGLRAAGDLAERAGVVLVVEPLNTLVDHAGYFLDSPEEGTSIVREAAHPAVRLLFDVYHMQIMRGHVIETIRGCLDVIRHFHSAGVPGRHELDSGELQYPGIVDAIARAGWSGCFGLEYFPADERGSADSLARMRRLLPDRSPG